MENIKEESSSKSSSSKDIEQIPTGAKLLIPFAVLPVIIVCASVGVFMLFGKLAHTDMGPSDYLKRMQQGSTHKRWQAAYELSRFLSRADVGEDRATFEKEMLDVFKNTKPTDSDLRRYLLVGLGQIGSAQSLPTLTKLVNSNDDDAKIYALWALGRIGDAQAAPTVRAQLESSDPGIQKTAAFAMGFVGSAEDIPKLKALLESNTPDVRWNAALALAQLGNDSGAHQILQLLNADTLRESTPGLKDGERNQIVLTAVNAVGKLKLQKAKNRIHEIAETATDPALRAAARNVSKILIQG